MDEYCCDQGEKAGDQVFPVSRGTGGDLRVLVLFCGARLCFYTLCLCLYQALVCSDFGEDKRVTSDRRPYAEAIVTQTYTESIYFIYLNWSKNKRRYLTNRPRTAMFSLYCLLVFISAI